MVAVLVISCPCALVISVPLSFFGGIGGASRSGVLVKGSSYLEALARAEIVVFDKTGTLTRGRFKVTELVADDGREAELLALAAHVEGYSVHPIAASIRKAYGQELALGRVQEIQELAGQGLQAVFDGKMVLLGNEKLMTARGIEFSPAAAGGTLVYAAVEGRYAGFLRIEDELKPDAAATITALHRYGVKKTVMLTGDSTAAGEKAAAALGIDEVWAGLLPADKVERVEALLPQTAPGRTLAFVGDGINDAPALATADIGFAVGSGTDIAVESADIVLVRNDLESLVKAVTLSRKTMTNIRQNLFWALIFNCIGIPLAAVGMLSPIVAGTAMAFSSVTVVSNSLRLKRATL